MNDLRLEALRLALQADANSEGVDVVATATSYYAFLAFAQDAAPAAAPATQTRGRKAKGETNGVADPAPAVATPAAAAPAEPDVDPFDTTPPAAVKALVIDDVRNALVAAQKRLQSPEKARGILKTVGGVDNLNGLQPQKFASVKAAADAAGV